MLNYKSKLVSLSQICRQMTALRERRHEADGAGLSAVFASRDRGHTGKAVTPSEPVRILEKGKFARVFLFFLNFVGYKLKRLCYLF